jgi:hypothetical protein
MDNAMSFSLFNLGLPALMGYALFVGLSGRFLPWVKPAAAAKRPTWFLALWVGLSVAAVLGIAMYYSQAQPLSQAIQLAQPVSLILAALWLPGVAGSILYRRHLCASTGQSIHNTAAAVAETIAQSTNKSTDQSTDKSLATAATVEVPTASPVTEVAAEQSTELTHTEGGAGPIDEQPEWVEHYEFEFNRADDEVIEFNEVIDMDDHNSFSFVFDTADVVAQNADSRDNSKVVSNQKCALLLGSNDSTDSAETTAARNDVNDVNDVNESNVVTDHDALMAPDQNDLEQLMLTLEAEQALREQTETHLRITRKALKHLESNTRNIENEKADALMAIEEQLDQRVKEIAAASAKASREEMQRIAAETAVANIKQDLLQSKRDMRRNTEARAKALETANKSVAFARQSVLARTRAEARIKQLEGRLKQCQETVSSLIAALEKEKAHTQHDITEMAKELILQQKRINEKRTLDVAGRKTQKRLIRRIARSAN